MSETSQSDPILMFAHELRQPLRSIMMQAQRIQRQGDGLNDEARTRLAEIVAAARKQDELIASFVEYDQAGGVETQSGSLLPVRLVIQTACMKLEAYRKSCEAVIRFDASLAPTTRAPAALTKVIERVLHNAIKFRRADSAPLVAIEASTNESGTCVVRIEDDGIGIEPQYRSMVFEPFRRLNSPVLYPGCGLGLATCRKQLAAMGGTIEVEDGASLSGVAIMISFYCG